MNEQLQQTSPSQENIPPQVSPATSKKWIFVLIGVVVAVLMSGVIVYLYYTSDSPPDLAYDEYIRTISLSHIEIGNTDVFLYSQDKTEELLQTSFCGGETGARNVSGNFFLVSMQGG